MPTLILLGPRCSGKNTVADYLVESEGFERVRITSSSWASTSKQRDGDSLIFGTAADFLDYATLNWRKKYVTCDRMSRGDLDGFVKRPWVLLVGCEARTAWRWKRRNEICATEGGEAISLEEFVREDDLDMFGDASLTAGSSSTQPPSTSGQTLHIPNGTTASPFTLPPPPSPELSQRAFTTPKAREVKKDPSTIVNALAPVMRMCNLHIDISSYGSKDVLYSHLRNLDLTREDRMRPGWDKYFMTLAGLASLRSNCMKRRVGAVLVSNKRVISTGYNGTPRGMRNCNEGGCARCNSTSVSALANGSGSNGVATPIKSGVGLDECLCLHAEENALLEAGRDRVEGGVLYCNTCPCLRCAVKICQTGCREVCYSQAYSMDEMSARIFKEAGVVMRQIEMLD